MESWFKDGNEVIDSSLAAVGQTRAVCDFNEVWGTHYLSAYCDATKTQKVTEEFSVMKTFAPKKLCDGAEVHRGKWYHTPFPLDLHYVCETTTKDPERTALYKKDGWKEFQGSFYMADFSEKVLPIAAAKKACEANFAELVTIETSLENDFLKDLIGNQTVWIGLTKNKDNWTWPNNESAKYVNWDMDQLKDEAPVEAVFMNYWEAFCMPPPWQDALSKFIVFFVVVVVILMVILTIIVPCCCCCFACAYKQNVSDCRRIIPDFRVWPTAQPSRMMIAAPQMMTAIPPASAPPRFGCSPVYQAPAQQVVPPPFPPLAPQMHICTTNGCNRESWNGQPGQTCCRTCYYHWGEKHGPDCEAKACRFASQPAATLQFLQAATPQLHDVSPYAASALQLSQQLVKRVEVISIEPPAGHHGG